MIITTLDGNVRPKIKLPDNVSPTIQGRDFVIATVAAPTIIKEPEKPAATEEGAESATAEGDAPPAEGGAEGEAKTVSPDGEKEGKKEEGKTTSNRIT